MSMMIDEVMCFILTCCMAYTIYFEDSGHGFFNTIDDA